VTAPPSPGPVWDVINGYAAYWTLHAAVDLGLFDKLDRPMPARELASALGMAESDATLLAELLVGLGLLDTAAGAFAVTPVAARFLTNASPASMVDLVHAAPGPHRGWPQLAATLRRGTPAEEVGDALNDLYPQLVRATAATQKAVAAGVARELADRGAWRLPVTIVDLGCGSGAWLQALLEAAGAEASAVAVDRGAVLDVARTTLVGTNVSFVDGDYLDAPLPVEQARVVVLAHVLRAEPPERAEHLVRRAFQLLEPGGYLAVADYFRPDSAGTAEQYRAARHELTLAMTMRASTGGCGITEGQLAAWVGREPVAIVEPIPRQSVQLFTTEGAR
jgi:ubiquinone/menaquinone biosynthesis C-methylase UbiE